MTRRETVNGAVNQAMEHAVEQAQHAASEEAMNEALLHQQENGRWEWMKLKDSYFFGPNEASICTFETRDDASNDRSQYLAAPIDAYGRRVRDKATIVNLLCLAAECEVDCDGSAINVVWHPRDANGNNWSVQTEECIPAIADLIALLQATYSIPDEGAAL